MKGLEPDSPQDVGPAEPEFEPRTPRRLGWAETHDIDVDVDSPMTSAEEKEERARTSRVANDPLKKHSDAYRSEVSEMLKPYLGERAEAHLSPLTEAVHDAYSWSLTIAAKTHRALSSFEFSKDEETAIDTVQTDANGSAKVALVAIEQSKGAWATIAEAGLLDVGLVNYVVDELAILEGELRERFPFAMAFVRPGFDEEIPGVVRPWSVDPVEDFGEEGADD